MIYLTEWWDSYDEPGMAVSKSHTHSIYHTANPKRNQVGSYVRQWIKKKKKILEWDFRWSKEVIKVITKESPGSLTK